MRRKSRGRASTTWVLRSCCRRVRSEEAAASAVQKAARRKPVRQPAGAGGSGVAGRRPRSPSIRMPKQAKAAKAHAVAKKTRAVKAHKPRKWSPDESVALCSARAVATALELLLSRTGPDGR